MNSSSPLFSISKREKRPLIIAISGNIACGKTTLMKMIAEKYNKKCFLEGIKDWGELLEKSYSDPKRYSLAFQLRIVSEQTLQKKEILEDYLNEDVVFIERSSDDGRYVFIEAKKELGHVDDTMIYEFDRWFNIHNMGIFPDLTVYLQTSVDIVYSRIMKRHQSGDALIERDYLELLHSLYEKRYSPPSSSDGEYSPHESSSKSEYSPHESSSKNEEEKKILLIRTDSRSTDDIAKIIFDYIERVGTR